jgi:hypothetical protein
MRKYVLSGALAVVCAGSLAAAQQSPATSQPTTQPGTTATQPAASTTLVGCLYHEKDVPGRQPNVAEQAGVMEDYILADAKTAAQPGAATPGATGTAGSVPATGNMYKVEQIADEKLRPLVGKRVEVTGRIDPEGATPRGTTGAAPGAAGAKPDRGLGPDQINLPELEATSIREVSGTCPAKPAKPPTR